MTCTDAQLTLDATGNKICPYTTGQQFIDTYGFDYISLGGCVGVLFGYVTFMFIISFLAVRYLKTN